MLTELHIQNLALIEDLAIAMGPHFNVLTGETGAGKTILIAALELLRGGKADADLVRIGAKEASVTATFTFQKPAENLLQLLEPFGWQTDDPLILRRVVSADGKSRAYCNGQPVPLQTLKNLQTWLFDIASQHEQQRLLETSTHATLLEDWAGLQILRAEYENNFSKYRAAKNELEELQRKQQEATKQLDWLRSQFQELTTAHLQSGEETTLTAEREKVRHAAGLYEALAEIEQRLYSQSESALSQVQQVSKLLQRITAIDPVLADWQPPLEQSAVVLEETARGVRNYLAALEEDPKNLEEVESRLALLQQLKRKYQGNIEELIAKRESLQQEIFAVDRYDELLAHHQQAVTESWKQVQGVGEKLAQARNKAAKNFSKQVENELADLHMAKTQFFVECKTLLAENWTAAGSSQVEFLLSPNVGEPLRPLARIASGGELSRILLALKGVLMDKALLADTFIFDEVDTGVGGATADAIGKKLLTLSKVHQILCVTHLPQVASFATHHLKIYKQVIGKRTVTQMDPLSPASRADEIARMLGGAQITATTRAHAAEMLKQAKR